MKKLRFLSFALIICLVAALMPTSAFAQSEPETSSATSVLVGDVESGRILYDRNAYTRSEPASLTKMMTLLLACESVDRGDIALDDMVTVSASANEGLTDDSSTAHIYENEEISVRDLLYCVALASANEACNILAEEISGSQAEFVSLMNKRASDLGCSGTVFENAHGLPSDGHYTTARDLFLIARAGMQNELFAKLVGTADYETEPTNSSEARQLHNSNALLCKNSDYGDDYLYDGALGVKTGHTENAGYCLVSCAERGGVKLIAVVLGADSDGEGYDSFGDTIKVLDWAFGNFSYREVISESDKFSQPVLLGGTEGKLGMSPTQGVRALVASDADLSALKKEVSLTADDLGTVRAGDIVGSVKVLDTKGNTLAECSLRADSGVTVAKSTEPTQKADPDRALVQRNVMLIAGGVLLLIAIIVIISAVNGAKKRRAARRRVRR